MLAADDVHLVNLRVQKSFGFGAGQRLEFSADVFNLFNSDAAFGFLSADVRSATFGVRTSIVQPRVGTTRRRGSCSDATSRGTSMMRVDRSFTGAGLSVVLAATLTAVTAAAYQRSAP